MPSSPLKKALQSKSLGYSIEDVDKTQKHTQSKSTPTLINVRRTGSVFGRESSSKDLAAHAIDDGTKRTTIKDTNGNLDKTDHDAIIDELSNTQLSSSKSSTEHDRQDEVYDNNTAVGSCLLQTSSSDAYTDKPEVQTLADDVSEVSSNTELQRIKVAVDQMNGPPGPLLPSTLDGDLPTVPQVHNAACTPCNSQNYISCDCLSSVTTVSSRFRPDSTSDNQELLDFDEINLLSQDGKPLYAQIDDSGKSCPPLNSCNGSSVTAAAKKQTKHRSMRDRLSSPIGNLLGLGSSNAHAGSARRKNQSLKSKHATSEAIKHCEPIYAAPNKPHKPKSSDNLNLTPSETRNFDSVESSMIASGLLKADYRDPAKTQHKYIKKTKRLKISPSDIGLPTNFIHNIRGVDTDVNQGSVIETSPVIKWPVYKKSLGETNFSDADEITTFDTADIGSRINRCVMSENPFDTATTETDAFIGADCATFPNPIIPFHGDSHTNRLSVIPENPLDTGVPDNYTPAQDAPASFLSVASTSRVSIDNACQSA